MARNLLILLGIGLVCAGCASPRDSGIEAPRTQLEVRAFETRTYDTNNPRLVMKSVVDVLQDQGFMIKSADSDLGLVTAERWNNIEHTKKEIKRARKQKVHLAESIVQDCTANVSAHGNKCRVRLSFQERVLGQGGTVMQTDRIDDAAFYQDFFAKVDKSVFLAKQGV